MPGPPPTGGPPALRAELEEDIRRIERENAEIDMLMEQVLVELERQEARRVKAQQRVTELESNPAADPAELLESRATFLTATERHLLFDSQRQVLEGKQRVLARYLQRLVEIDTSLAALPWMGMPLQAPAVGPQQPAPPVPATSPVASEVILQLRSQEDLRREIVRQIHDGPAQSLANIALQAEIVERLVIRGDRRAHDALESLRQMVQQALDTTKEFIFEVRPMVLDDLGLVPTLRRAAMDRSRRAGLPVDFDSQGSERRLPPDLETGVFRSIDEAVAGYASLRPPSIVVRLDWSDTELVATVEGTWPRPAAEPPAGRSLPALERTGETPPALLAMMEEKRTQERMARTAARSLPPERMAEIAQRARTLGMALSIRDDGQVIELAVPFPR